MQEMVSLKIKLQDEKYCDNIKKLLLDYRKTWFEENTSEYMWFDDLFSKANVIENTSEQHMSYDLFENMHSVLFSYIAKRFAGCDFVGTIEYCNDDGYPPVSKKYEFCDGILYSKGMKTVVCCSNLHSENYRIPEKSTKIESGAFSGNTSIKKLIVPSQIKKISRSVFSFMKVLEEVIIEEGVEKILDNAFECCYELKRIVIPTSVISIKKSAFAKCENVVLVVKPGSYAESFAKENKLAFVLI